MTKFEETVEKVKRGIGYTILGIIACVCLAFFVKNIHVLTEMPECRVCGAELKDHNGTYWCPTCKKTR